MTFFCFIESDNSSVPHMEPLVSATLTDALEEARDLMRLHSRAVVAHVHRGDERMETILPPGTSQTQIDTRRFSVA